VLDALVGTGATPTRDSFRKKLRTGELDDKEIEIEVADTSAAAGMFEIPGMPGANAASTSRTCWARPSASRTKKRKVKVKDAAMPADAEEADKLLDQDQLTREAVELVENHGIVFIDEIDKVATGEGRRRRPTSRARACSATCCR
jgi:ATP-dependent HslUV protease ATP-binding subunit HslU